MIICFSLLHMSKKKRKGTGVETTLLTVILVAWLHLIAPDVTLNLVLAGIVKEEAMPVAHQKVKYRMGRVELSCRNIDIILDAYLDPLCLRMLAGKSMSLSQIL